MALANPAFLYVGSDKYTSVAAWASGTAYVAGNLIRQNSAPTLSFERVYVCIVAGTSGGSEPSWASGSTSTSKGVKVTDNTVTWQECTGTPAVNGDATNTPNWNSAKNTTVALGQIIQRISGGSYQICTTAGTAGNGSEPAFSNTAGVTTADNSITWTSLGATGNYAAFAAPHARILNADAATWSTVAGSTLYISSGHAETQGSLETLAGGTGTTSAPAKYLSVSSAAAPPTSCTSGASVSTTGAFSLIVSGFGFYSGTTFSAAGGGANANNLTIELKAGFFENCTFALASTSSSALLQLIAVVSGRSFLSLINPTFTFGATSQTINVSSASNPIRILIENMTVGGSNIPTVLFTIPSSSYVDLIVRDSDLSNITGTLLGIGSTGGIVRFENCKLAVGVTMITGAFSDAGSTEFQLLNCDSGSKNYRFYVQNYLATMQQETTTVRTGGASDGTTPISWAIATTANTAIGQPFQTEYLPIFQWNNLTGSSQTATIEIACASSLTNADIWMELEYPGNASFPLGSIVSSRIADLATTATAVTTSAAAWGGSPANTQKMQVTFTPQMVGPIKARIYVAKKSITVYVDPVITVT